MQHSKQGATIPFRRPLFHVSLLALVVTCLAVIQAVLSSTGVAATFSGYVRTTSGSPIPYTYVGLLSTNYMPVGYATTDSTGAFVINAALNEGVLVVQPPTQSDSQGNLVFRYQPRMYQVTAAQSPLDLRLPNAVTFVLEAYTSDGRLMRWADFEANGLYRGLFVYATNLDDEVVPFSVWWVHGSLTNTTGGPREQAVPAVVVAPGATIAVQPLFWPTTTQGKLLLRADNAGSGFTLTTQGASLRIHLNAELARSAVANLTRRKSLYSSTYQSQVTNLETQAAGLNSITDPVSRARTADQLLSDALALRENAELDLARRTTPSLRQGTARIVLTNPGSINVTKCTVKITQTDHDFLFNCFEGSPYNATAFSQGRQAGFELATVLLGWNWTQDPLANRSTIDSVFGITALKNLGFRVKAHGVVWMQAYGIMPDYAYTLSPSDLISQCLTHQQQLLQAFGSDIAWWEAINEPANTNVVGLTRDQMAQLTMNAAANIRTVGRPTLVNSPHEWDFGGKYLLYGANNQPLSDYPQTFSTFITTYAGSGLLNNVDALGLQYYPGFHLSDAWGGLEGPCPPPAYLIDLLDRYTRFGKALHLTEFSIPSSYASGWKAGFWKQPWNETVQADYAGNVLEYVFAHAQSRSFGWWDLTDAKPAVVNGGLIRADGTAKPSYTRVKNLIASWTTNAQKKPNSSGVAEFPAYAGNYAVEVKLPNGKLLRRTLFVPERTVAQLTVDLQSSS